MPAKKSSNKSITMLRGYQLDRLRTAAKHLVSTPWTPERILRLVLCRNPARSMQSKSIR